MARKTPRAYQIVLDEHRRRLARLAERRGVARLRPLYDRAEADIVSKISRRTSPRASFTAHHQNLMLGQIRQGQALLAARLSGELGEASREAQVESLRGLGQSVRAMEREFTGTTPVLPIDEAATFAGVVEGRRESIMRLHQSSMSRYGARLVGGMEEQLALSLATGETVGEAIDRVQEVAGNEWWQAERIARTEILGAANLTHADGIAELREEMPDMMVRWTEHVSDDGTPLDDRVGNDSIAMHGQVAAPGAGFTMPTDAVGVSPSLLGRTFYAAPLRPNGREVLVPWRRDWGVPGWEWRGGRKVWLVR